MGDMSLNIHQRRRVEITLYLIEEALDEISQYLGGELPRGEMYLTISDIASVQRKELRRLIEETKLAIAGMKNYFGLEVRVNEVRAMIMGYLGSMWESLHNTRPRNLSGFGAVSPELFETLDPKLMELVRLIEAMSHLISKSNAKGE